MRVIYFEAGNDPASDSWIMRFGGLAPAGRRRVENHKAVRLTAPRVHEYLLQIFPVLLAVNIE